MRTLADQGLLERIAESVVPLAAEGCTIDLVSGVDASERVCLHARHVEPGRERALRVVTERPREGALARRSMMCDGEQVGEIAAWGTAALPPLGEALLSFAAAQIGATLEATSARRRTVHAELGRTSLVAMVGHELRSPLQALTMGLELVQMRVHSSEDGAPREWLIDRLDQLGAAVGRLGDVAQRLLEASAKEGEEVGSRLRERSLVSIASAACARLRADAAWAGCTIDLDSEGPTDGRWDEGQLDTVVEQLLANALKYGAGRPVSVRLWGRASEVCMHVRDQGSGMRPEDVPRIFERFFRGAGAEQRGGLGVGLWTVKRIVEAHGGTIECSSVLGAGTTFLLRLPRDANRSAWAREQTGSLHEESGC